MTLCRTTTLLYDAPLPLRWRDIDLRDLSHRCIDLPVFRLDEPHSWRRISVSPVPMRRLLLRIFLAQFSPYLF